MSKKEKIKRGLTTICEDVKMSQKINFYQLKKIIFLVGLLLVIFFKEASGEDGGGRFNGLSYEYSSLGYTTRWVGLDLIMPYLWFGIGTTWVCEYETNEKYEYFEGGKTKHINLGIIAEFPINFYFVPLAKNSEHDMGWWENIHFYLTYSPWRTSLKYISLENFPEKIRLIDTGIGYTRGGLFTVKAGYMNLDFSGIQTDKYILPPKKYGKYYVSAEFSIGWWFGDTGKEEGEYALVPFIRDIIMGARWRNTKAHDTISAYESFLERYPQSKYSDTAESRLEKLKYMKYIEKLERCIREIRSGP